MMDIGGWKGGGLLSREVERTEREAYYQYLECECLDYVHP